MRCRTRRRWRRRRPSPPEPRRAGAGGTPGAGRDLGEACRAATFQADRVSGGIRAASPGAWEKPAGPGAWCHLAQDGILPTTFVGNRARTRHRRVPRALDRAGARAVERRAAAGRRRRDRRPARQPPHAVHRERRRRTRRARRLRRAGAGHRHRRTRRGRRPRTGGHLGTHPFNLDLDVAPLVRVLVVRLADQEHLVHLAMHHIGSDGWSPTLLLDEIAVTYGALRDGTPARRQSTTWSTPPGSGTVSTDRPPGTGSPTGPGHWPAYPR
ncbi:hypothetical protein CA850_23430 [Micromonospora echinospora]|nr:hypothetical protein CA850_23430 [Micromonospora echinospora]